MTPAALTSGALAGPSRPLERPPAVAASDDTAWRTLVIFSAYRIVLALGLAGAYAFLNTIFPVAGRQPVLAVNAWAVCDGNDASDARCAHWELSNAEAVAAARTLEGQFRRAVEAAAAENGLRVAANARMLVWVPDARAEIARSGWMLGLSVAGVWLLFELIAATLRQVRRLFGA